MTGAPFHSRLNLCLLRPAPPPRRRLEVRLHVQDGRSAFGRSRVVHLNEADVDWLIDHALRLESRRRDR
jgi:hypothetical protein